MLFLTASGTLYCGAWSTMLPTTSIASLVASAQGPAESAGSKRKPLVNSSSGVALTSSAAGGTTSGGAVAVFELVVVGRLCEALLPVHVACAAVMK